MARDLTIRLSVQDELTVVRALPTPPNQPLPLRRLDRTMGQEGEAAFRTIERASRGAGIAAVLSRLCPIFDQHNLELRHVPLSIL